MLKSDEALIYASADLSRISPENWRRFLEALAFRSENMRKLLVNSPTDTLQVQQGHAREISQLLDLLQNCVQLAEKLKGK